MAGLAASVVDSREEEHPAWERPQIVSFQGVMAMGRLATVSGWTSAEVLRNGDLVDADWGVTLTPAPATGATGGKRGLGWGIALGRPRRVVGKTIPDADGNKPFQAEVRAPLWPH